MVVFKRKIHGESRNNEGKKKSHLRGQKGFSFIGPYCPLFLYYVTISPSRSVRCETNKPPAMRVRIEGYTKKLQTRYNKGVQANCKAKGEKYGTKGS